MRWRAPFLLSGLCGLALIGCSSKPAQTSVSGKVTLGGSPIAGANVVFLDAGSKGAPAKYSAVSKDDGSYAITGLKAGSYRVGVNKLVPRPGAKLPPDADATQLELSGQGVNLLPGNYAEAAESPFAANVKDGDNTGVDFDLKGSLKEPKGK